MKVLGEFCCYGSSYHRVPQVQTHSFPTRRAADLARKVEVFNCCKASYVPPACPLRRLCPQGPHLAIQLRCDLHLGRRREVNAAVPCPTDQDAGLAVLAALARPGRPPGRRNGQLGEQLEGALLQFRRQAVDLEKVPLTALAAAPW